jgi:hypothetical protein
MNRDRFALFKSLRRMLHPKASDQRTLIIIVTALVLFTAVAASGLTQAGLTPTPNPTASAIALKTSPAATPAPLFVDPNNVTNGIIIGGVILVMIIIGGTLQVLRPRSNGS